MYTTRPQASALSGCSEIRVVCHSYVLTLLLLHWTPILIRLLKCQRMYHGLKLSMRHHALWIQLRLESNMVLGWVRELKWRLFDLR